MEQEQLGSYKVLKKIGAGGMAKVYLAVHEDVPNLKVILKILDDPRLGERFRQEADKLALLDGHPNICRIKHFFNYGDDTVIAMEYIEGVTLEERINVDGKLPVDEAVRITVELLDILGFAHSKGVFHRDIKPGNIMLDKQGVVKVIDFGIAKSETDPNLTIAGTACGTPAYMAPEQFNPSAKTNYSLVDIYAAGTTLYVMLTGEAPFKGDNPFAIRDTKLFNDPPHPREINHEIPKHIDDVIVKSIAKLPEERFQTAEEMAAALAPDGVRRSVSRSGKPESLAADVTVDTSLSAEGTSPTTKKKNKIPILAGIGGLLAATVITLYLILSGPSPEPPIPLPVDTIADTTDSPPVPVTGIIDLAIVPNGDVIINDSVIAGNTDGISMMYDTGTYAIRVENSKAIKKVLYDTITVSAGLTTSRTYKFSFPQRKKPKPATTFGTVKVGSSPRGAEIYIDGARQARKTPFSFNKIESGKHTFRVLLNGHAADSTILVKAGHEHKIIFKLDQ